MGLHQLVMDNARSNLIHAGTSPGFPSSPDDFSVGGAPSPGTSAVEVPVSTSTAITGGGVPSPAPVSLPPGASQQTCEQFQSVCISSESSSAPFEFTVTLTCLPGNSAQVPPPPLLCLCLLHSCLVVQFSNEQLVLSVDFAQSSACMLSRLLHIPNELTSSLATYQQQHILLGLGQIITAAFFRITVHTIVNITVHITIFLTASVQVQVPFEASIVATQAGSGVQSVNPSSGTISLDQPTTFTIRVDPSAAQTGYSTAYLALSQTYPQDATLTTLMGTVQISHFNFGPTSVNFSSIAPNGDGTANVTAVVAVDFVAPSGVTVPMLGAITTDASNVSTACAATAPSVTSGATTSYTCDAAVPIKVSCIGCEFAIQHALSCFPF